MHNQKFCFLVIILILISLFIPSGAFAWHEVNKYSSEYTESGDVLPPRGVYMGTYYSGSINVLQGEELNQLVIQAEAYSVTPDGRKSDASAYLFCMFFKDNPDSGQYRTADEIKEIIIKISEDQYCRNIEGKQRIVITAPEEARHARFAIWNKKSISTGYPYDLDMALIDIYGYSMNSRDGANYALFYTER